MTEREDKEKDKVMNARRQEGQVTGVKKRRREDDREGR